MIKLSLFLSLFCSIVHAQTNSSETYYYKDMNNCFVVIEISGPRKSDFRSRTEALQDLLTRFNTPILEQTESVQRRDFMPSEAEKMVPYSDSPDVTWEQGKGVSTAVFPSLKIKIKTTDNSVVRALSRFAIDSNRASNMDGGVWMTVGTSADCGLVIRRFMRFVEPEEIPGS